MFLHFYRSGGLRAGGDGPFCPRFFLAFILSPASGFAGSTAERTQVAWRFAVAFLLVLYVLMMEILDHFAARSIEKLHARCGVRWGIPILSVLLCTWGIWNQQSLLQTNVKRTVLLRDQFDHPVGSQGYFSAYDYVQNNVRNSTVIVENGLPFFLYDPGFTNSVTRSKPADFIVFIKFPNPDFSAFVSHIDTPAWSTNSRLFTKIHRVGCINAMEAGSFPYESQ